MGGVSYILPLLFLIFLFWSSTAYGVPGPGIRSELQLQPKLQRWPCQIFNPLCWARDRTCVPVPPRCCRSHCSTVRTPHPTTFYASGKFRKFSGGGGQIHDIPCTGSFWSAESISHSGNDPKLSLSFFIMWPIPVIIWGFETK